MTNWRRWRTILAVANNRSGGGDGGLEAVADYRGGGALEAVADNRGGDGL